MIRHWVLENIGIKQIHASWLLLENVGIWVVNISTEFLSSFFNLINLSIRVFVHKGFVLLLVNKHVLGLHQSNKVLLVVFLEFLLHVLIRARNRAIRTRVQSVRTHIWLGDIRDVSTLVHVLLVCSNNSVSLMRVQKNIGFFHFHVYRLRDEFLVLGNQFVLADGCPYHLSMITDSLRSVLKRLLQYGFESVRCLPVYHPVQEEIVLLQVQVQLLDANVSVDALHQLYVVLEFSLELVQDELSSSHMQHCNDVKFQSPVNVICL